jgi:glycosyltransferase involved in cell wall biosynthesis
MRRKSPNSTKLTRVVYVVHADAGNVPPRDVLDRWTTAPSTVSALAATGRCEVFAIASTRWPSTSVRHNGVSWEFVYVESRAAWRVAIAVRKLRPDVVHVNGLLTSRPAIAIRVLCGRRPRIVMQHHGEPPGTGKTARAQRFVRRLVNGYLFTGAAGQAETWRDAGVLTATTPTFDVLESSADLRALPQAPARSTTGMVGTPAMVWVGRLIDGKDPITVLRAFEQLGSDHGAHLWMIYSDATMELAVRELIGSSELLRERVHLVGYVPHDQMAAWLSAADIIISTSHSEGSGYALIEALACGCTPVVTDIAPHQAIVGSLGRTFPPGDVESCSNALSDVTIVDRDRVVDDFHKRLSWPVVADQLLVAYGIAPIGTTTIGRSSSPIGAA